MSDKEDYLSISKDPSIDLDGITANLEKIRKEIDITNSDFQNDKLAFSAQRVMLAGLLQIIPTAITSYMNKPGQGSAYALTNLYSQVLELFSEIRGSQSLENQVEYISEQIIDPMLKSIITSLFDAVFYEKQKLKQLSENVEDPKVFELVSNSFDSILRAFAPKVNNSKLEAEEKLKQFLVEVK